MTTMLAGQTLHALLEHCGTQIEAGAIEPAVLTAVDQLDLLRRRLLQAEWRALVAGHRDHPVHALLCEDPFTRGAREKPRGYAGDAATLDFVYRHRKAEPSDSPRGCRMLAVSTGTSLARAVRDRCDHVAAHIEQTAMRTEAPTIISVACGHLRELNRVPAPQLARVRIVGLDQDAHTIAALHQLHPTTAITPIRATVRHLISGRVELPPADLIYASGLFDYLEDQVAVALIRILMATLRPGASLVVQNLTPDDVCIGFMEAVMDWWMIYRDTTALERIAREAGAAPDMITTHTLSDGRIACVEIVRPAR